MLRRGARFYVTAREGRRTAFLSGPYASHMSALSAVPYARVMLREVYGRVAAVGTASCPETLPTVFGQLPAYGERPARQARERFLRDLLDAMHAAALRR